MNTINNLPPADQLQQIISNPVLRSTPTSGSPTSGTTDTTQTPVTDRLELSGVSYLLDTLSANNIRTDKVASIKAQIDAGTYETDDKLDAATEKLLDDLQK